MYSMHGWKLLLSAWSDSRHRNLQCRLLLCCRIGHTDSGRHQCHDGIALSCWTLLCSWQLVCYTVRGRNIHRHCQQFIVQLMPSWLLLSTRHFDIYGICLSRGLLLSSRNDIQHGQPLSVWVIQQQHECSVYFRLYCMSGWNVLPREWPCGAEWTLLGWVLLHWISNICKSIGWRDGRSMQLRIVLSLGIISSDIMHWRKLLQPCWFGGAVRQLRIRLLLCERCNDGSSNRRRERQYLS